MSAPSEICQSSGGTITPGNPCHLSPTAGGLGLGDWQYLVNFRPPQEVKVGVKKRFWGESSEAVGQLYHPIEDGVGQINLDLYVLPIGVLPSIDGIMLTPAQLFRYLRVHLDNFMDHSELWFEPYEPEDLIKWESDSPLCSVMHFELGGHGRSAIPPLNPENMSVVASEVIDSDHWIFTPLWTPRDENHPVSGNRQFGLATRRPDDVYAEPYDGVFYDPVLQDTLYFYARGADRCTGVADWALSDTIFSGGHSCWWSAFNKLKKWVNANGGETTSVTYTSKRYDWDTIKSQYWKSPPQ